MTRDFKTGEVVVVNLGEYNNFSNTYLIAEVPEGSRLLSHPLAADCYIIKSDTLLNNGEIFLQDVFEKSFNFILKNKNYLSSSKIADTEALIYYFVIKKELTLKQKSDILNTCGMIASRILNNDTARALQLVKSQAIFLESIPHPIITCVKDIAAGKYKIVNKKQLFNLFSLAGFCLAQMEKKGEQ